MKRVDYYYFLRATLLLGIMAFALPHRTYAKPQAGTDLIVVGLLDGPLSGTPKFAELYVVNDIPDLSIFGLGSANNGGGTDGQEWTFPADPATAGSTIYVANDTAAFRSFMGFGADYQDGGAACNFNGDDAFELFENGLVVDIFGDINLDGTGTPWEYLDSWVKRVNATGPDGTTFVPGNWTHGPLNVFDGTTSNASATAPYPLAAYMPSGGSGGGGIGSIDLILKGVIYASTTVKATEYEVLNDIPDLSIYGVGTTNNGGGSDSVEWSFPAMAATAGDRIYVARDSAAFNTFFGFDADYYDPSGDVHNFNGDDGIEVFKNGSLTEIFGDTLLDGTGEPWEYTDGWAHRIDGTGPDSATFVLANWTFSSLGNYVGTTSNATAPQPYPVAGVVNNSDAPALVLVGVIHANADVKSTEYYVLEDIADLSIYGLGGANNGGGSDSVEWAFPAASATQGDRLYVTRDSATFRDFFGFDANFYDPSGAAHNFNGDDAFEVFENGVVIDVYGDINVDGTGEAWEYNDSWAARECATGPDSATFVLANWTIAPIDNFVGTTMNSSAPQPYPYGTYDTIPCPIISGPSPMDVVITEIMYNSPGTDLEYIELFNNTSDSIDLTGYSIDDAVSFTFPSYVLAPGEFVLISDDSTTLQAFWGVTAFNWVGSLNNSGESITLKDTAGMVVDSVFYDDAAPWTTTPDGRGPSLVLCNPDSNNNVGSNWQRAITSSGNLFDGREVFGNPGVVGNCVDMPIVGIQAAEVIIGEADGDLTVLFYLDNPNDTAATTVDLDVALGGTADATDYTFNALTVTFPAGTDTAQSTIVGIVDDTNQESEESFTLTISNPSGGAMITNDSMRITIIDNDAPLTYSLKIIGLVHGPLAGVPKAVELLALNDIPNLSLYGLGCANNGGGTDGQEYTFPPDAIAAGTCFYVTNDTTGFLNFFGFAADYQDDGAANNFNGDDAFEIYESGSVIDVFGEVDVDGTGTPWEYTLGWAHRKANTGPDTATFVLDNWDLSGVDALLGLATNDAATNPYPVMMCDVVGLDPVDLKQEILLYPNPAQNAVRYDSEVKLEKIVLRNMLGQEIIMIDQPAASAEIDLSQLANDIYLLSFISENGIWTQKLVVRK